MQFNGQIYYGEMSCFRDDCPKQNHVWDSPHTVFGPYLCSGKPKNQVQRNGSGVPTWLTDAFQAAQQRKAEREEPADVITQLKARVAELERENADLFRRLSNQEKYNVDSRRSLGEHIDKITAENRELKEVRD